MGNILGALGGMIGMEKRDLATVNSANAVAFAPFAPALNACTALEAMPNLVEDRPWRCCTDERGLVHDLTGLMADTQQMFGERHRKGELPGWLMVDMSKILADIVDPHGGPGLYNIPWLEFWANSQHESHKDVHARSVSAFRTQDTAVHQELSDVAAALQDQDVTNLDVTLAKYREVLNVVPGLFGLELDENRHVKMTCPKNMRKPANKLLKEGKEFLEEGKEVFEEALEEFAERPKGKKKEEKKE